MSAEIRHYTNNNGRRPYEKWFSDLDKSVHTHVESTIERLAENLKLAENQELEQNTSFGKYIGDGVHQLEVGGPGPGYRIFYTIAEGHVYLLGGGDKSNQQKAIDAAKNEAANLKDRLARQQDRDNSPAR